MKATLAIALLAATFSASEDCRGAAEFSLPFAPESSCLVLFGPGDAPHHLSPRNLHAYDFAMPVGSMVCAAASGVVTRVVGQYSRATGRSQDNNFIAIRHEGGLVSEYHHLMRDGLLVREGERVERGEVIGFSGASGKAEGAHLHFVVLQGEVSLPISFRDCQKAPGKGERCTSKNVPLVAAAQERVVRLEEISRAVVALGEIGAPQHVRKQAVAALLGLYVGEPEGGFSQRRAIMALRVLERRWIAQIVARAGGGCEAGVDALVSAPERER